MVLAHQPWSREIAHGELSIAHRHRRQKGDE